MEVEIKQIILKVSQVEYDALFNAVKDAVDKTDGNGEKHPSETLLELVLEFESGYCV